MPDLITHTAAAYAFARPTAFPLNRAMFFLGTIFPDIISRPFYIIFPALYPYTVAVHTPLFIIIAALFFSEFFVASIRPAIRKALFAGIALHLGLDALQKHHLDGYFWLFPFSWESYSGGLFWPGQAVEWIPVWVAIILVIESILWIRRRFQNRLS